MPNGQPADTKSVLRCVLRSPEKTHFEGEAESLDLPMADGQVEILPGHATAFLSLAAGAAKVRAVGQDQMSVEIGGGACWVEADRVIVLF